MGMLSRFSLAITDVNQPPNITNPTKRLPKFDTVYVQEHTDEGDPNLVGTVTSVFTATGYDVDGDTVTWDIQFTNGQDEQLFEYDNKSEYMKYNNSQTNDIKVNVIAFV